MSRAILMAFGAGLLFATGSALQRWPVPAPCAADSLAAVVDSLRGELQQRPRNLQVERDTLVVRVAEELGLDPVLALALAYVENPRADSAAVSSAGAVGLLQVMPPESLSSRDGTWVGDRRAAQVAALCGPGRSLLERECNVRVGLAIYRDYLAVYGSQARALAAYNGALAFPTAAARYVSAVEAHVRRLNN